MYYRMTQDNDGHHYVIPVDKTDAWDEWREIDSEDERAWTPPDFAVQVDGGRVTFDQYEIG